MKPSLIVFDVNETLSDMSPMGQRFVDVGAPAPEAKLWFATLLRDGFALTAAGDNGSFAVIGAEALRGLLTGTDLNRDTEAAVEHIMTGFSGLGLHPDVVTGVKALHAAGYRLATLTNGSTQVAEQLFTDAGIRNNFEPAAIRGGCPRLETGQAVLPVRRVRLRHPARGDAPGRRSPLGPSRRGPRGPGHRLDQPDKRAIPELFPGP
ncbi:haloacid dehalogenase type II [Pseudarthrobacter sp. Fe7]|nr:haloacid dehalogenase type II [Pseudarthrobacter sp. Fe7]